MLADLITQVSDAIEKHCGREFASDNWVEYYSGTANTRTLSLKHRPITAISEINDDTGRDFGSSTIIDPEYYTFEEDDSGLVYFVNWVASRGTKNIRVSYTGGYTTIPGSIVLACHKLCGGAFNKRKSDGQASDGLGNVTFSYESIYSDEVQRLLQPYMNWMESD